MPEDKGKKIGDLNGRWAFLQKWFLISWTPLVVGVISWLAWMTSSVFELQKFADRGDRFTQQEGAVLERRITVNENNIVALNIKGVMNYISS